MRRITKPTFFIFVLLSLFAFGPHEVVASEAGQKADANRSNTGAYTSVADKNSQISTSYAENDGLQSPEDVPFPGIIDSGIHKASASVSPVQEVLAAQSDSFVLADIVARDHALVIADLVVQKYTPDRADVADMAGAADIAGMVGIADRATDHTADARVIAKQERAPAMTVAPAAPPIPDIGLGIMESREANAPIQLGALDDMNLPAPFE